MATILGHILTIFSFFYNKTQLKSIKINANDRSSDKNVKIFILNSEKQTGD